MSWQLLTTIQTSADWLLTESVTGTLFRITHFVNGTNIQSLRSVIAQAFDENADNTYFDFRRLAYKPETEAFLFIQPQGLLNRKLAIKRLDNLTDDWKIAIEVLDGMPESISLPIEISEVSGLLDQLEARVTRLEFLEHAADTETNPHKVTLAQVGGERPGAGAVAAADAIAQHETTVNHPVASNDIEIGYQQGFMSAADKAKLDGIAEYATRVTGLGSAAVRNVGTTAGTVAAGDDFRLSNSRSPFGTASGVLSGNYPSPSFAAGVFARSLGNPGWEKLHSGKVQEWGSSVVTLNSNGDGVITLPLVLSTGVQSFYVVNGDADAYGDRIFSCSITSLSSIRFNVRPNPGAVSVRVNWGIIGA